MGLLDTHRQRAADLLTGATGTSPWIVPTSPAGFLAFHPVPPDRSVEDVDIGQAERAFDLTWGTRRPLAPINHLNRFGDYAYPLAVRVSYVLTGAGDDEAERIGEQGGSGALDAVEDRAELDRHTIEAVLGWDLNWGGLTPTVITCRPMHTGDLVAIEERAVLTVRFELWVRAAVPGSFAPSV